MTIRIVSAAALVLTLLVSTGRALEGVAAQAPSGDRVILITLDGARTQEIFGGLDVAILRSTLKEGQTLENDATYKRFWAPTPEERRRKLMPFFWGTLMTGHGSIAGNRALDSRVTLKNKHWFSYPGYSEILVGEPHDDVIKSNDAVRNPYPTVLEIIRDRLNLAPKDVAVFASWGVFNEIAEQKQGALTIDAGPDEPDPPDAQGRELAAIQGETLPQWANVRHDYFTFRLAMRHLEAARPRVLYIAFDETDDWAHDGRYDRTLDTFARTDRYLETLWQWLQKQPEYGVRTHILLTTDHGRGDSAKDWRDHGARVADAENVWIAFVSPHMPQRGEWRNHVPLSTSQIAATLAKWAGVDLASIRPTAGAAIALHAH